jgi:DNA gyrase subunit A
MIINKSGVAIRLAVENLRVMGRATQGVRLINLKGNDSIAAVAKVMREDEEEVDLVSLMTSLLATEDGETICTALVTIGQQLQTQNKILIKILSEIKN